MSKLSKINKNQSKLAASDHQDTDMLLLDWWISAFNLPQTSNFVVPLNQRTIGFFFVMVSGRVARE